MYKYQPSAEMRNVMLVKSEKLESVDLREPAGKESYVYSVSGTVFATCDILSAICSCWILISLCSNVRRVLLFDHESYKHYPLYQTAQVFSGTR
jgi:hypothetical protein